MSSSRLELKKSRKINIFKKLYLTLKLKFMVNIKIFTNLWPSYLLITEAGLRVRWPADGDSLGSSFWTPATPPSKTIQEKVFTIRIIYLTKILRQHCCDDLLLVRLYSSFKRTFVFQSSVTGAVCRSLVPVSRLCSAVVNIIQTADSMKNVIELLIGWGVGQRGTTSIWLHTWVNEETVSRGHRDQA